MNLSLISMVLIQFQWQLCLPFITVVISSFSNVPYKVQAAHSHRADAVWQLQSFIRFQCQCLHSSFLHGFIFYTFQISIIDS